MHPMNPDLLRALSPHSFDGRTKDPHAHHRTAHLAQLREDRRLRHRARLHQLLDFLALQPRHAKPAPCRS
ncbi:MAG: hypothetical protein JNK34_01800 [Tabrizicola sp.]|nr:hypothetical protein [Tabrizicola sp.]